MISLISKPIFQTEQDNRDGARDIPKDAQNIPEMPCLQGFTLKLLCQVCCGDPALFPCLIPDFCTRQGATVCVAKKFLGYMTTPGEKSKEIKQFSNDVLIFQTEIKTLFQTEISESSSSHRSSDNTHSPEHVPHLSSSRPHPVPLRSHCTASCHARTPIRPDGNPSRRPVS